MNITTMVISFLLISLLSTGVVISACVINGRNPNKYQRAQAKGYQRRGTKILGFSQRVQRHLSHTGLHTTHPALYKFTPIAPRKQPILKSVTRWAVVISYKWDLADIATVQPGFSLDKTRPHRHYRP